MSKEGEFSYTREAVALTGVTALFTLYPDIRENPQEYHLHLKESAIKRDISKLNAVIAKPAQFVA